MKKLVLVIAVLMLVVSCGAATKGEPGPVGSPGPAGSPGADGASFSVKKWNNCSYVDTSLSLNFYYNTTAFSDGVLYVECEIQGAGLGVSNSGFYAADQNGSTTGYCVVSEDIDTPSFGEWNFSLSPGPQAKYVDTPSTSNNQIVTLTCTTGN